MALHTNEVSEETKAIFRDVRNLSKRMMDRFYEGFLRGLDDVQRGWRGLAARERNNAFDMVTDTAREIMVDKSFKGGGAEDGIALGTFNAYVAKVKQALKYNVPLRIAEDATVQDLQRAQRYAKEVLGNEEDSTIQEKMVTAYNWVKEDGIKASARLNAERLDRYQRDRSRKTMETSFTLPNPADFEGSDEDSDDLLTKGINGMLAWLRTKSLQPHLDKSLKSAEALREVLGVLTGFEEQQRKTHKSKAQ